MINSSNRKLKHTNVHVWEKFEGPYQRGKSETIISQRGQKMQWSIKRNKDKLTTNDPQNTTQDN